MTADSRDGTLEVRGLDVYARTRRSEVLLVDDVAFTLQQGTILGVVGETGAGKTLTVRAIAGLLPSGVRASGTLRLGSEPDIDLASGDAMARIRGRDIGVVLQNPMGMFDPLMRIGRQVVEGVVLRKVFSAGSAMRRAVALFESMGLDESLLDLYPHQLSGGMSQRAAIAMALMPEPKIIVADEPTTALDAHLRLEVLALLRLVASQYGASVILVSHDLGLVSHVCDRVMVMYAGRILEEGPTSDVLSAPQHPYTAALLQSSATLEAPSRTALTVIAGQPPQPGDWPPACVFEPRCKHRFELCRVERPGSRPGNGHAAACHLAFTRPSGFKDEVTTA